MIGNQPSLTGNIASKTISVIATAGQTLFQVTGGYNINEINVYRNGVRLASGRDYNALNGASVTLLSPAAENDVIDFQIFEDFRAGDALNTNTGGDIFGDVTINGTLTVDDFVLNDINTTGIVTAAGFDARSSSGIGVTIKGDGTAEFAGISTFYDFLIAKNTLGVERPGGNNAFTIYDETAAKYSLAIRGDGNFNLGGTIPASPNTELDQYGNAEFAGIVTAANSIEVGPSAGIGITLNTNGSATLAGSLKVDTFINAGTTSGAKATLNSGNFVMYGYSDNNNTYMLHKDGTISLGGALVATAPNIKLNADGNATFAGKIEVGPSAGIGATISAAGAITASSARLISSVKVGPVTGIACTIATSGSIECNARIQADVTSGNSSYAFVGKSNHPTRGTFRATNDGGGAVFVGADGSTDNLTLFADGSAEFAGKIEVGPSAGIAITLGTNGSARFAGEVRVATLRAATNNVQLLETTASDGGVQGIIYIQGGGNNNTNPSLAVFDGGGNNFTVQGDGTTKIGGTLPASPNISLNAAAGIATFAGRLTTESGWTVEVDTSSDSGCNLIQDESNGSYSYLARNNGSIEIGGVINAVPASSNPNISLNATNGSASFNGTVVGKAIFGTKVVTGNVGLFVNNTTGTETTDFAVYGDGQTQIGPDVSTKGSSNATITLFANGNADFDGAVSKGSGSFKIDHPIAGMSTSHHLVHSFIEGPQADLIYRGQETLVGGIATVNIDTVSGMTDGTFVLLNTNISCFTSNETDWTPVRGSVTGNVLTIEAQDNTSTATVSWMVVGERKDQHMIDTEWTDENGRVITEPLKPVE